MEEQQKQIEEQKVQIEGILENLTNKTFNLRACKIT